MLVRRISDDNTGFSKGGVPAYTFWLAQNHMIYGR